MGDDQLLAPPQFGLTNRYVDPRHPLTQELAATLRALKGPGDALYGKYQTQPEVAGQWSDRDDAREAANADQMNRDANSAALLALTGATPRITPTIVGSAARRDLIPRQFSADAYHGSAYPFEGDKINRLFYSTAEPGTSAEGFTGLGWMLDSGTGKPRLRPEEFNSLPEETKKLIWDEGYGLSKDFAPSMTPLRLDTRDYATVDAGGRRTWGYEKEIEKARSEGKKGVVVRNALELGEEPETVYVSFPEHRTAVNRITGKRY